jgi:multicomponent Na+:H+ antiporter subunit B
MTREETEPLSQRTLQYYSFVIALGGMAFGVKIFFSNWLPRGTVGELVSAGVIPLYNIFIGMEVAASILTIFLALLIFKEELTK